MDKELPNTETGRSAFTVFGYGGDRYTELFDRPMEDPPESFNATNSIAFPSRPSRRGMGGSSSRSPEHARKMRLGGPDSPNLILQSLGSSGETFTGITPADDNIMKGKLGTATSALLAAHVTSDGQEGKLGRVTRRYSGSQASSSAGGEDSARLDSNTGGDTHTDQFLQMLGSTLTSSGSIYTPGRAGAGHTDLVALAQASGPHLPANPTPSTTQVRPLTRQGSSPALYSLAQRGISRPEEQQRSSMQGYLQRRSSSSALSTLGEAKLQESSGALDTATFHNPAGEDRNPVGVISTAVNPISSRIPSDGSSVDTTDSATNSSSGTVAGRSAFSGVLARTRKFGAWLGQVTEGERIEVTKKDLNVFAPTSF